MSGSRVLVTGASGQLATAVLRAFADRDVTAVTRATLDVTDIDAVQACGRRGEARCDRQLRGLQPCGRGGKPADRGVCGECVRGPDAGARRRGARRERWCITDPTSCLRDSMVLTPPPYDESAPPSPRSVYAASKLVGEWLALEYRRARYVLRVESLFGLPADWTGTAWIARHDRRRVSRRAARSRCSPIASSRRATSSTLPPPRGISIDAACAARSVSLRELRVMAPGTRSRIEAARVLGVHRA